MESPNVFPLRNRMTEAEYEAERQRMRELYGDGSQAQMAAKRDQAMADLFARSGWTQEELAKQEGKTQPWVTYRLRFGRFLHFITTVINAAPLPIDLTENKFRAYWDAADKHGGNERQRFDAVAKAIAKDAEMKAVTRDALKAVANANEGDTKLSSAGIPDLVGESFGDGKWHDEQEIVDHFRDRLPDDVIRHGLKARRGRNGPRWRIEHDPNGRNPRYRIFNQARTMISTQEIAEKLLPHIKTLIGEGKKNMVTMSPGTVLHYAQLLKKQIDEWEQ